MQEGYGLYCTLYICWALLDAWELHGLQAGKGCAVPEHREMAALP